MELNAKPRKLTALLEEVNSYPHAKTAVGLTNKATKVIKDMYINACTYNIEFLVYRQYLPWDMFCFLFMVCVFWMPDFRINWGGGWGLNLGIRPVSFLTEFKELSVILLASNIKLSLFENPAKFTSWIAGILNRWPFDKESNWCHQKVKFFPVN